MGSQSLSGCTNSISRLSLSVQLVTWPPCRCTMASQPLSCLSSTKGNPLGPSPTWMKGYFVNLPASSSTLQYNGGVSVGLQFTVSTVGP